MFHVINFSFFDISELDSTTLAFLEQSEESTSIDLTQVTWPIYQ